MSEEPGAYVYMLRCSDGSYYVGSARRGLDRRISEHNEGTYGGYTSTRRPVTFVWAQHFQVIIDAIDVERQIKGWSRAKKEALIRGDYGAIQLLSKRKKPDAIP
jgi:putative endonuclease